MADREQVRILRRGVDAWNRWRRKNPSVFPDLQNVTINRSDLEGFDLSKANLAGANLEGSFLRSADLAGARLGAASLSGANLAGATLAGADLSEAKIMQAVLADADLMRANLKGAFLSASTITGSRLSGANLSHTQCSDVDFSRALLAEADLTGAILEDANFTDASLCRAKLTGAYLAGARMVRTNLEGADLSRTNVYGISVWDVRLDGAVQTDLAITSAFSPMPTLTVDNIEVAQFVYLLLGNARLRHIIDTVSSKVVLILGRFTPERRTVLDSLREELRKYNYIPVLCDFDQPQNRNLTETVSTLAHIARFIIADISSPRSIPQELMAIVPSLPSVPVQPLLVAPQSEWGMFESLASYPWVLPIARYEDQEELLGRLKEGVIDPAEYKALELTRRRDRQS